MCFYARGIYDPEDRESKSQEHQDISEKTNKKWTDMMLSKAESTINNHAGGPDSRGVSSLNLLYSGTVRGK